MKTLILYSTEGCHLCEQAKALLLPLLAETQDSLREVDIAESDELMARYGVTIPVLVDANSAEKRQLNWPFDQEAVKRWLAE